VRETEFIKQNKHKWESFEEQYNKKADPEKTGNLFLQITDDLSYARTYYSNRSVRIYLNNLAQKVFHAIYKNRVRRRKKLALFWSQELPQRLYDARRSLLLSFCIFALFFFIGMFSSMHDASFARFILGDSYVNMTEENIRSGDPMAVYKEASQFDMLLAITVNNLWVSFLMLAFGILFGVGTVYLLMSNGIMIGAFQYFFIERGLFWESFLTIWVHGALEVSAIVIAGAAGLTLGGGLLFPGTYTRMQSFRLYGIRAVHIFLGITPVIVLAAINESFLTRYTETPDLVRGILIFIEFTAMYLYFVYLPKKRIRLGLVHTGKYDDIPATTVQAVLLNKLKSRGQVFADSFQVFRKYFMPISMVALALTVIYGFVYFVFITSFSEVSHNIQISRLYAIFEGISDMHTLTTYSELFILGTGEGKYLLNPQTILYLLNVSVFAILLSLAKYLVHLSGNNAAGFNKRDFFLTVLKSFPLHFAVFALLHLLFLFDAFLLRAMFYLLLPAACIILTAPKPLKSIGQSTGWFLKHFLEIELLLLPLVILSLMVSMLSHSIIAYVNFQFISVNIPFNEKLYEAIEDISISGSHILSLLFMLGMLFLNFSLMYFSLKEAETAGELQGRIKELQHKTNGAHT